MIHSSFSFKKNGKKKTIVAPNTVILIHPKGVETNKEVSHSLWISKEARCGMIHPQAAKNFQSCFLFSPFNWILFSEKRLGGKDRKFEVKHLLLMSSLIDVRCGYQLIIDSLGRESISCSYSASFSSDSQFARNSNFFPFILFLLSLYIPESEKPKHCGFRVMELALVHHLDPPQLRDISFARKNSTR
ncbi:hypothetical protein SCA6_016434 [Theobroma cacao]